jgi:hypothetical protein
MAFLHSGQGLSVGHGQITDRPVGAAWLVHWQRLNVECECPLLAQSGHPPADRQCLLMTHCRHSCPPRRDAGCGRVLL